MSIYRVLQTAKAIPVQHTEATFLPNDTHTHVHREKTKTEMKKVCVCMHVRERCVLVCVGERVMLHMHTCVPACEREMCAYVWVRERESHVTHAHILTQALKLD